MQGTWIQSLGWEDLLEKEMATHFSILAWKIPWTEEPSGLQFMGSQKSHSCLAMEKKLSQYFKDPISWVTQSCPTLFNPMDCSMPGFSVHHLLPELVQIPVHQGSDAIQPSHLPLSPSPPAFNLSQHQGLFQGVSSLHQVAKVLEFQCQHQSSQRIFRTDLLYDWLVGSLCSPRDSQESSPTPHFKMVQLSLWSNSHIHSWLWEKPHLWLDGP